MPGVRAVRSVDTAVAARSSVGACTWDVVPTPNRNSDQMDNLLQDVAVMSADDAWAIGQAQVREEGGRGRTVILRWDGSRWRAVRHPQRWDGLAALAGSSPSDVWAVGTSRGAQGLVLNWNGVRWRTVQAVDPGTRVWYFTDIVAIGPNDVWAVGFTVSKGVGATLIEHWDGTRWSIIPSPNPPPWASRATSAGLTSVGASSTSDVWAVGSWNVGCPSGGCSGGVVHTLTERWDGTSWAIVPSPDAPGTVRTADYLLSVSVAGPTDAWAAGVVTGSGFGGKSDRQLLERWDGYSWTVVPGADRSGASGLSDVVAVSPDDAWAVGQTGAGFTRASIERWDGTSWSKDLTQPIPGWLSSVAVGPSGEIWAVGATQRRPQRTLALRCSPI
jgi:hypothetical protein